MVALNFNSTLKRRVKFIFRLFTYKLPDKNTKKTQRVTPPTLRCECQKPVKIGFLIRLFHKEKRGKYISTPGIWRIAGKVIQYYRDPDHMDGCFFFLFFFLWFVQFFSFFFSQPRFYGWLWIEKSFIFTSVICKETKRGPYTSTWHSLTPRFCSVEEGFILPKHLTFSEKISLNLTFSTPEGRWSYPGSWFDRLISDKSFESC